MHWLENSVGLEMCLSKSVSMAVRELPMFTSDAMKMQGKQDMRDQEWFCLTNRSKSNQFMIDLLSLLLGHPLQQHEEEALLPLSIDNLLLHRCLEELLLQVILEDRFLFLLIWDIRRRIMTEDTLLGVRLRPGTITLIEKEGITMTATGQRVRRQQQCLEAMEATIMATVIDKTGSPRKRSSRIIFTTSPLKRMIKRRELSL